MPDFAFSIPPTPRCHPEYEQHPPFSDFHRRCEGTRFFEFARDERARELVRIRPVGGQPLALDREVLRVDRIGRAQVVQEALAVGVGSAACVAATVLAKNALSSCL